MIHLCAGSRIGLGKGLKIPNLWIRVPPGIPETISCSSKGKDIGFSTRRCRVQVSHAIPKPKLASIQGCGTGQMKWPTHCKSVAQNIGKLAERLKATVLKTVDGETHPSVQIGYFPPQFKRPASGL